MTTKLTPPPVSYGVIRERFPSIKYLRVWFISTTLLAALYVFAINSSPKLTELGYQIGNRSNWSWAELAWGFTIPLTIGWLIMSGVVFDEPSDNFRTNILYARLVYASKKLKPWIKKNYGITLNDNEAEMLLTGWTTKVYRTNELGQQEWVTIRLQGADNIERASWSASEYDEYGTLRLLVIPDPTKPPAPYEFFTVEKAVAA